MPGQTLSRLLATVSFVLFGGLILAGSAAALEPPTGKVILTISGKIADPNRGNAAVFDLAMLQKLPQQSFTTSTLWYPKPIKFQGPLLRDVLAAAKAKGLTLKAMALNDYQTTIPFEDAAQFDVILATHMDDEVIPVRTKGPLFIVYPYDSKDVLRATVYYERSAWQLKSLVVE